MQKEGVSYNFDGQPLCLTTNVPLENTTVESPAEISIKSRLSIDSGNRPSRGCLKSSQKKGASPVSGSSDVK